MSRLQQHRVIQIFELLTSSSQQQEQEHKQEQQQKQAPLLDDVFAKQRRTLAEIATTETGEASAKIPKIEEGSSVSSAAALNVRVNNLQSSPCTLCKE